MAIPNETTDVFIGVMGDSEGEKFLAFRARYPNLHLAKLDPLYALPIELLKEVATQLEGWLSIEELAFEHDLGAFCQDAGAVGIAENSFVTSNLLLRPTISEAVLQKLALVFGGAETAESVQGRLEACNEKLNPVLYQLRSYLGWLLTNHSYLEERDQIRRRRRKLCLRQSFSLFFDGGKDGEFREFLNKWMLTEMRSWEVPVPQGPNLSGAAMPVAAMNRPGMTNLTLPCTISTAPERTLKKIMKDTRRANTPAHLREWQKILDRKAGGEGLSHYDRMFHVHFYLNIVLRSRYGRRMGRQVAKLDQALGKSLHLGEDRVRQVRQHAERRLTIS